MIQALLHEMHLEGLRPASSSEAGWYWRSLDGHMYWVTDLEQKGDL